MCYMSIEGWLGQKSTSYSWRVPKFGSQQPRNSPQQSVSKCQGAWGFPLGCIGTRHTRAAHTSTQAEATRKTAYLISWDDRRWHIDSNQWCPGSWATAGPAASSGKADERSLPVQKPKKKKKARWAWGSQDRKRKWLMIWDIWTNTNKQQCTHEMSKTQSQGRETIRTGKNREDNNKELIITLLSH